MLGLNKKPGDSLTAAEVNQIGEAIDENTEALSSALFASPESEPVEQPEIETVDRAIADEDGNNIKETYLSRGVQSLTSEQQTQVQENLGIKSLAQAIKINAPQNIEITIKQENVYRYIKNGTVQTKQKYFISNPIAVKAGEIIQGRCNGTTNVSLVSAVTESGIFLKTIVAGIAGTKNFTFIASEDMYIELSGTINSVFIIKYLSNFITVVPDPAGGYNRALYEAAGAVYNETTGFYELNGLVDITEEQMANIYARTKDFFSKEYVKGAFANTTIRTNILNGSLYNFISVDCNFLALFRDNPKLEVIAFKTAQSYYPKPRSIASAFYGCSGLVTVTSPIDVSLLTSISSDTFVNCVKLTNLKLFKLKCDVRFSDSPLLSKDSILYMIQNSTATSTITITLHPDAYSMAMADDDIQAALVEKTYVSLASA